MMSPFTLFFKDQSLEQEYFYKRITSKKQLLMIACGFKILMLFDFGMNVFDYSQVDIKACTQNGLFRAKCGVTLALIVILRMAILHGNQVLKAYFDKRSKKLDWNKDFDDDTGVV